MGSTKTESKGKTSEAEAHVQDKTAVPEVVATPEQINPETGKVQHQHEHDHRASPYLSRDEAAALVQRRRDAHNSYLEALERELDGYERFGNTERAKDVKAEIARVKREAVPARDLDPFNPENVPVPVVAPNNTREGVSGPAEPAVKAQEQDPSVLAARPVEPTAEAKARARSMALGGQAPQVNDKEPADPGSDSGPSVKKK